MAPKKQRHIPDPRHKTEEDFKERMTAKRWRTILIALNHKVFIKGHIRLLMADQLGHGIVMVHKVPLEQHLNVENEEAGQS